ncbi:MAG: beta-N-acetylhexosaminidase [Solirubrobacteraceae bacterium]|nr:beta-N-acetylhexosaminidase [Solirubrobacteraceae bacterium]
MKRLHATAGRHRAIRAVAAAVWLAGLTAAAAGAQSGGSTPTANDPAAGLSARQLAGLSTVFSYGGTTPPAALRRRIARGEAGGVILFGENVGSRARLRATMRGLQAIRRPAGLRAPLLVMIDQEGGQVKRLGGAPSRSPAALGRLNSAAVALREGRATAANLLDAGVNVNLAPVLDVGRPGSFQSRTERSYSRDPARVSSLGSAFVRGLQEGGVAATLKHFPGLGTVSRNEDDVAQRVDLPLATLRRIDESPFVAASAAGAKLAMTSTAIYPALSGRPALLSRRVSTDELRGHAGFTGVSITDDLDVVALRRYGTPTGLGRQSLAAGNDLLLYCGGYASGSTAADALARDVTAGRIDAAALRASVRRVLALRAGLR